MNLHLNIDNLEIANTIAIDEWELQAAIHHSLEQLFTSNLIQQHKMQALDKLQLAELNLQIDPDSSTQEIGEQIAKAIAQRLKFFKE